jgi:CheY-like chemotaxis protein
MSDLFALDSSLFTASYRGNSGNCVRVPHWGAAARGATACSIPNVCLGGVQVADHAKTAVLVVTGEALPRLEVVETLSAAGYKMLEATGADEALRYLRSGRQIDVVVTDIEPDGGPTAWEVAEACRSARSDIPVICISRGEAWNRILSAIERLQATKLAEGEACTRPAERSSRHRVHD